MQYTIVGLGNPGEEYEHTRHNAGRMLLDAFRRAHDFPAWEFNKKANTQISKAKLGKASVTLLLPDTFMNNSGKSLKQLKIAIKKSSQVLVVHDELDLPIGFFKISFGRGSGGHHGLDSIIKELKTKDFIRLRVGISPVRGGVMEKPRGEQVTDGFLLKRFTENEYKTLLQVSKKINEAIEVIISKGYIAAMNAYN